MTSAALLAVEFVFPQRLWLLGAVALLGVWYLVMQRRRKTYAVRFTNIALLDSVAPKRPGWRRHIPAALLLLALAGMVGAASLGWNDRDAGGQRGDGAEPVAGSSREKADGCRG